MGVDPEGATGAVRGGFDPSARKGGRGEWRLGREGERGGRKTNFMNQSVTVPPIE